MCSARASMSTFMSLTSSFHVNLCSDMTMMTAVHASIRDSSGKQHFKYENYFECRWLPDGMWRADASVWLVMCAPMWDVESDETRPATASPWMMKPVEHSRWLAHAVWSRHGTIVSCRLVHVLGDRQHASHACSDSTAETSIYLYKYMITRLQMIGGDSDSDQHDSRANHSSFEPRLRSFARGAHMRHL
jgi:hypothetical protein